MLQLGATAILTTDEFIEWVDALGRKRRALVDGLYELRWKIGIRAYFSFLAGDEGRLVLMLWGGDKNGQDRDIVKARRIQGRASA